MLNQQHGSCSLINLICGLICGGHLVEECLKSEKRKLQSALIAAVNTMSPPQSTVLYCTLTTLGAHHVKCCFRERYTSGNADSKEKWGFCLTLRPSSGVLWQRFCREDRFLRQVRNPTLFWLGFTKKYRLEMQRLYTKRAPKDTAGPQANKHCFPLHPLTPTARRGSE